MTRKFSLIGLTILLFSMLISCSSEKIEHGNLIIELNGNLESKISNKNCVTPLMDHFMESEYLISKGQIIGDFKRLTSSKNEIKEHGMKGFEFQFEGENPQKIIKIVSIKVFDDFPNLAIYKVKYENGGDLVLDPDGWVNHNYKLESGPDDPDFWSFQGSSTSERADWIRPIKESYSNQNYMGMNNSDYGGGIPVLDLWRKDGGIAIGHVENVAKLISFPVKKNRYDKFATISAQFDFSWPGEFKPGDQLESIETFVYVHQGDCFNTLRTFSTFMQARGMKFPESEPAAFEPMWCAWGYERDFSIEEVIGTLPKVKELGIKWATLDDGFQITEGDWTTNKTKFPNGDQDMLRVTKAIHDHGLKAQIWWAPLAVSPDSKLLEENPNILLKTDEWAPQYITWWDAWYMAPTDKKVLEHTRDVVTMFIDKWDFDGIKLDGQHLNAVEPDHGENHDINYPEEAVERLPEFFQTIYETAREIKPNALLQHCPCGTCMSFYNMPTTNQTVSSDPTSSKQIRQKGKVYKAIMPQTAYFGDHVELSDNGDDFATSFGIGAVLGTKFTWPKDNPNVSPGYLLTPEKELVWKKWFDLYNEKMLSKGEYLGDLYDIAYDIPETHLIKKEDKFYYSFYAEEWNGPLRFKGLDAEKTYKVYDYVNDVEFGQLKGTDPVLEAAFKQHLLVQLIAE